MLKSKLAAAVLVALAFGYTTAHAQQTPAPDQDSPSDAASQQKTKRLEQVTVTGSLIPQSEVETAQPVVTITAQDMKAKGFTSVAQALQQASFSVGSVQGQSNSNSFTTGAETTSMFGLAPGYTKYLIDGRPMGNFPGLYNGTDTFNSISGIPMDMVDHIDILPGGQSSLYGSDAIAGVINIVLKKKIDAPVIDVRYGWDTGGGGANRRISLADSFTFGKFTSMVGVQFEDISPIWAHDRDLTRSTYSQGIGTPANSRDYVVVNTNLFTGRGAYAFEDPSNCANVSAGYHGTETKQYRAGLGNYCGSPYAVGYSTVANAQKNANLYTHNTFDVSDNLQLYGDLLYNYSEQKFTNGSGTTFWGSSAYENNFIDPRMGTSVADGNLTGVSLQKGFTPEEVGGYQNIMNKQIENSYMLTFGGKGTFGQSNWDYDLGFTHSDDQLIERQFQRFTLPMEQYFQNHVLGPYMGTITGYPVFEPNYAALYNPVSQADFRSFTGYTTSYAKTWDNMVRGQVTNGSLFTLPGGDAGVAFVAEAGNQGWDSSPDPRLLSTSTVDLYGKQVPEVWGTSATPGAGHRSREAATAEFRAPLLNQLTLDISGRYDRYNVDPQDFSHKTYNIGIEYRPFDSLLLRGRYGTAFKAPTLSDEFQGVSGNYGAVPDYLNCGRLGYTGGNVQNCTLPYGNTQYNGQTEGNPALKPITAKVWSYGVVWAPLQQMSISVDYLHYDINNEVTELSPDLLSNTEYLCDIGTLNPNSGTCATAFAAIKRGPGSGNLLGQIISINTPKLNVANEQVNAIVANLNYAQNVPFGRLSYNVSYSDDLKHTYQDFVTDPHVNELTNPNYSTDFKTKANASITWTNNPGDWSTTLYVNRYGRTPNYLATELNNYTDPGTGHLRAWVLWNATVTYSPMKNLSLSFLVNNLFNAMPPIDHSIPNNAVISQVGQFPGGEPYNQDNYNVFGRAMYLEAKYTFGNGKNN